MLAQDTYMNTLSIDAGWTFYEFVQIPGPGPTPSRRLHANPRTHTELPGPHIPLWRGSLLEIATLPDSLLQSSPKRPTQTLPTSIP